MRKWILLAGAAVGALAIIFVVVGLSNLGPLIKKAVNLYGPEITKTPVRIGDVSVSLFSGKANLKDFYLGNPKGFKSTDALKIGSILLTVDEKSLAGNPIVIERIEVIRPDITYEKTQSTDNLKAILDNIQRSPGESKSPKGASGKTDQGKKILIKDFVVREGKVHLSLPIFSGGSLSATLPDIRIRDIGKEKNGVPPAEAFKEMFEALYGKINSHSTSGMNEGKKQELENAKEEAKKNPGAVIDTVKGLMGK